MIITKYTPEDLEKLPLRAIVALAARCARRVEPLAMLPDGQPGKERRRLAAASAIRLAEDFAKGQPCPSADSVVEEAEACRVLEGGDFVRESAMGAVALAARAAAAALRALALRTEPEEPHFFGAPKPNPFPHLADVTADRAAHDAFLAAVEAIGADGSTDNFVKTAIEDYQRLLQLNLGSYPEAGQPVDPSPRGPLGSRQWLE
jgi:hypothetical protein